MKREEEGGKKAKIFLIAFFIIALDQISKLIIIQSMELNQTTPIIKNILHLTYIQNTGAGFGMFKGMNTLLIFIAIIAIGLIFYYYDKIPKKGYITYSIGLLLGGVIGNLIDRISYGYVIDFLDFRIWPAFNVADSAVTIGAILLIIYLWQPYIRSK